MRITLPQCFIVAAICCLAPGCDRDTETQRHGDKVNDQVEYHSYVQRMKKRLAEADRRIESLENSIEKRTKSAAHDAKTKRDVDQDHWQVSLDDIKKLRTDVGKLGDLDDDAERQWRLKERQTEEQLDELDKRLEGLEHEIEKGTVKALEKIEEAVRGAKERVKEELDEAD
jgi:hypothetical protein